MGRTYVPAALLRRRRDQVESLHLQGRSTDKIAAKLRLPIWTVRRDLRVIEKQRLARVDRNIARERLRSIAVHRESQRTAWKVITHLMENDDYKSIVPCLRAITAAEKEIDAILRSFADSDDDGPASIRDLFADFTPAELERDAALLTPGGTAADHPDGDDQPHPDIDLDDPHTPDQHDLDRTD